jgi:hypothetical protein
LPVSFSLDSGTNCSLTGDALRAEAVPAQCIVVARQPGNSRFAPAPSIRQTYIVDRQPLDGSWGSPSPSVSISIAATGGSFDVEVIVTSTGSIQTGVSLTAEDPTVCSPDSDASLNGTRRVSATITVSLLAPGACTLQFVLEGAAPYVVLNNPPRRTYAIES